MIAFIEGAVRLIRKESIVAAAGPDGVSGVGYEIFVSNPQAFQTGQDIFLYTWQQFREDNQLLYGFVSEEEYNLFCSLISVKGIGCKTALNMLGKMPADEMIRAISQEDVAALKKLPGIGARTASQIVLDLRGVLTMIPADEKKDAQPAASLQSAAWKDTREALLSLGYKPAELSGLEKEFERRNDLSTDAMLRLCLQIMAKRKGA